MSISVKRAAFSIGSYRSTSFDIDIEGEKWRLDDFILSQSLLSYNILTFTMHKGPEESENEISMSVNSQIIGKRITISVETENIENLSLGTNNENTAEISFDGVIFSASGCRQGGVFTINVEARSWEALLDDNPNCKSFENLTLDNIVGEVMEGYQLPTSPAIQARFDEFIPYCVQYNETNYQFLQRLARRYGEWLYNDGQKMVFGGLDIRDHNPVYLAYPSKDIPSYSVDLKMAPITFRHLTSSYNAFEASIKDGIDEMQMQLEGSRLYNSAWEASQKHYTKKNLQNLHSGGFADDDGRETILNVSIKTQAGGEEAGILTYSGETYCSKLKVGSTLVIVDNFITDKYTNKKSNVKQDSILITGLIHTFSADETYSNHFVGIPSACEYPPYANSDVYPVAPSCRAKVTDNEDPMNWGRVRVQFDWQAQLDSEMQTPWLRIAQPYAGGGKGFSFIPEIGEEVMVDFEGGNAERPYIKGTLFNGVDYPDADWLPDNNNRNPIKAIRTRNGHTIEIHDEGEGGYIQIYDNNKENYVLTFSTDEKLIKLKSTGNIELYAENDIIMHAGNDIVATADNDMNITVKHNRTLIVDNDDSNTIKNDQAISVGKDQTSHIGNNQTIEISEDQTVKVAGDSSISVGKQASLEAKDIVEDATEGISMVSKTHKQKASQSMFMDGGSDMNIKASKVKIN